MMNRNQLIVSSALSLVIVAGGIIAYRTYGPVVTERGGKAPVYAEHNAIVDAPLQAPQFPPKTSDEGGITVTVTPLLVSPDIANWDFDVVLSTHTQELGVYDLSKLATLTDSTGASASPISWAPDETGGHHIGGTLRFARIVSAKNVELRIKDIGATPERVFEWNLE